MIHPAFAPAAWEQAPQYVGPGNHELYRHCDATILDFDELSRLALGQEEADAFELDGLGVARAPLKLGHLPAAFYRVQTGDLDAAALYIPPEPEILVVLDGVLSVLDERRPWLGRDAYDFALITGQVAQLPGRYPVEMKALGFENPKSLALAVFTPHPDPDELIISHHGSKLRRKTVPSEAVNLPYTTGEQ